MAAECGNSAHEKPTKGSGTRLNAARGSRYDDDRNVFRGDLSRHLSVAAAPGRSRGRNQLHEIFNRHFDEFCEQYETRYAKKYRRFRVERIEHAGRRFCTCGDYLQGVAQIRCTNLNRGHDYFRPFSCNGFYLCPLCSQKRPLLFAEFLADEVLLDLPHRRFVFTQAACASGSRRERPAMPKALRPFFRHERRPVHRGGFSHPSVPAGSRGLPGPAVTAPCSLAP